MDTLKTILTIVAIILGALGVLAVIGFIYSALFYLMIFGILCLGGLIAFRFLRGSDAEQIAPADPQKELKKVERLLNEYKRK